MGASKRNEANVIQFARLKVDANGHGKISRSILRQVGGRERNLEDSCVTYSSGMNRFIWFHQLDCSRSALGMGRLPIEFTTLQVSLALDVEVEVALYLA
jgi:hypothetical protein